MADLYVSPSGSGVTCSIGSPCTVAQACSVVVAGDTIHFASGTYTGNNGMLQPVSKIGTALSRITAQADIEGTVVIDGQNARQPMLLNNCAYWTVQGIDFGNSSAEVGYITANSNSVEIKRCCFWNAAVAANAIILLINNSINVLIEDCASFGTGRKCYQTLNVTSGTTKYRRNFGQFMKSTNSAPKLTQSVWYDSFGTLIENCIFTENPQSGNDASQNMGIMTSENNAAANRVMNVSILGTLCYLINGLSAYLPGYAVNINKGNNITLSDVVVYLPPDRSTVVPFGLGRCETTDASGIACASQILTIEDATAVGGAANSINAAWTQTNIAVGASVPAAYSNPGESLYTGTQGAKMRYRYVDGVLTGSPLWPWPMNTRIIAAMTTAGYTPVNVDTTVFGIFGTSPDAIPHLTSIGPSTITRGVSNSNFIIDGTALSGPNPVINTSGGINFLTTSYNTGLQISCDFSCDANATVGPKDLSITTDYGTSNIITLTVIPEAPVLNAINDDEGHKGDVIGVTLTGDNFDGDNLTINVGMNITVTNIQIQTRYQMTCNFEIGVGAALGPRNVSVTTDQGTSGNVTFTVLDPSPPYNVAVPPNFLYR